MRGYIYTVVNNQTNEVYVGSTAKPPPYRWALHKCSFRKNRNDCSSHILFQKYGIDNCAMVIEKEVLVEDMTALRRMERETMEAYGDRCVNKYKAYLSPEEHQAYKIKKMTEKNTTRVNCHLCGSEQYYGVLARHRKSKRCKKKSQEKLYQQIFDDNSCKPENTSDNKAH